MKFFVDTANVADIREAAELGLLDGVTTNPTLLSREVREGRTASDILLEITKLTSGPVSAEVVALDAPGMVREGLDLRKLGDNVVVKIPITVEGLKAIGQLNREGVPTNCTLVFSAAQALMAAKAGASFVSPFVGRLDDLASDGLQLIERIRTIYSNYDFATEILVASVRSPEHVVRVAMIGADVVTMPPSLFPQLVAHPLTDRGLEQFLADWEKTQKT
jgi:transaldolase